MTQPGRIDIHSHLLPGIDDGCVDLEESMACIKRLKERGFAGSICTPHVWTNLYPQNIPQHIQAHTAKLQQELADRSIEYQLWSGGEVRLFEGAIEWFENHGVPTLANSRCVLTDYWNLKWPKWAKRIYEWLLEEGYQPILAHPERMPCAGEMGEALAELLAMGIWLQGNSNCMTGEEGHTADHMVRGLLQKQQYKFIALDIHRLETLETRLEGLDLIEMEFGSQTLDHLTTYAPRELILS